MEGVCCPQTVGCSVYTMHISKTVCFWVPEWSRAWFPLFLNGQNGIIDNPFLPFFPPRSLPVGVACTISCSVLSDIGCNRRSVQTPAIPEAYASWLLFVMGRDDESSTPWQGLGLAATLLV